MRFMGKGMPSRSLIVRAVILGAAVLPVLGFSKLLLAQPYPAYPPAPPAVFGMMQPEEADALVRSLGLTPLAPARLHGPVLIVDALGQEGSHVQVTVDRRSGRILQIVRIGHGAPQWATVPPGPGRMYESGYPAPGYVDDEDDLPPAGSGPRVITREGIEAEELPPPGAGPRLVVREPDVTGSMPDAAATAPVDPLLGVPKEFRNRPARGAPVRQQTAARPADSIPRVAPLPRPRPADAPSMAQDDPAGDTESLPPVQPLE